MNSNKFHPLGIVRLLPVVLLATLLLHGCSTKRPVPQPHYPSTPTYPGYPETPTRPVPQEPTRPVPQEPTHYTPKIGPAGSLYNKAQTFLSQGNYDQAEMALERALRVEPRNGHYWYSMARVKYKKKQYSQTMNLCLKSKSFASKNEQLKHLNDALIEKARQQLKY